MKYQRKTSGSSLLTRAPITPRNFGAAPAERFSSAGFGTGWVGVSATANFTSYYYLRNINNFNMSLFEGWATNLNLSIDVGVSIGPNISFVQNPSWRGEYLIGVGLNLGFGLSPTVISSQETMQYNYLHY